MLPCFYLARWAKISLTAVEFVSPVLTGVDTITDPVRRDTDTCDETLELVFAAS